MMLTHFIIWVCLIGGLMYTFRDKIRTKISLIPHWPWWFVSFVLCLALLEEFIAVGITNLAPFFGVAAGQAYFTASGDYLDVVMYHSIIVFLPFFAAWVWALRRYKFSPTAVFFMWGITGICAELLFAGGNLFALIAAGFWIFVYGLMLWLPTYCLPDDRSAIEPRYYHYAAPILASVLFFAIFFIILAVIGPPLGFDIINHPKLHFAAMGG